jgi:hypothetical protein
MRLIRASTVLSSGRFSAISKENRLSEIMIEEGTSGCRTPHKLGMAD